MILPRASPIASGTEFKPFETSDNELGLGLLKSDIKVLAPARGLKGVERLG